MCQVVLQMRCMLLLQEGMQVPVAVKTCKETSEETMTEKFLEEACKYACLSVLVRNVSMLANSGEIIFYVRVCLSQI